MAALALVGAVMTGCSSDEDGFTDTPQQPVVTNYSVTKTLRVSLDGDEAGARGITRALTSGGVKTFAVGDQIAVAYLIEGGTQAKAVTKALKAGDISNEGKTATFTVTFTEEPWEIKGNYVYYTYPASITTADGGIDYSALNTQDGTLATLASNLDCCLAYSGWNGSDDLPALTLTNRFTIGKFIIKNPSGTPINNTLTSVTISDGANTYTITPTGSTFTSDPIWVAMQPVYEGSTVTVTATDGTNNYSKSITIAEDRDLLAGKIYPINVTTVLVWDGALAGKFSVSSTKQVYFSKGNLQYQASTGTWRFAEHQYDFIGGGNFLSESNTDWIDLYRWGTSGIDYTGHATLYRPWEWAYYSQYFNPYGSLTTNLYDGAGENAGKADWGYNAISNGGNTQNSGWRTLKNNTTDNEWQYIFNTRTTANEINSTSNARYTQARINTDNSAVKGIILFPDGSIGDTPSGVTWGTINAAASSWTTGTTQCTTAGWAALEAAGCVFLPAAGKYDDSGVSQAEIEGYYWSSSYASDDNAYGMYFYSNEVNPQYSDARHYGLSVRLVKDAN